MSGSDESQSDDERFPMDWDEASNNRKSQGERRNISRSVEKSDARKIVTGDATYTADYRVRFPDLAESAILRSDIPHGYVTDLDTREAESMDGVYAVIGPDADVLPDRPFTTAGQPYPEPSPHDMYVLREHVRYVGDPIAAVAAKDKETAQRAVRAIEVEYRELDAVLDVDEATAPSAPQLFDPDFVENKSPGHDYEQNRAAKFEAEMGDVEQAFADADYVVETEFETPYQSHCVPEPHTTILHRDANDRFVCITSTQVPNHTRRQLAHLFDIPVQDIRVIKPQVGAGFGAKQGMAVEPLAFALHLAAGRPVKVEMTRFEEFHAMRFRHPMRLRIRSAVDDDGVFQGIDLDVLANTGAYGAHGYTVAASAGKKPLTLYSRVPNVRFTGEVVHTNLPVAGAMRGYGSPQGHFALEAHVDDIAAELGVDPIELRRLNHVQKGDLDKVSSIFYDDYKYARRIRSCGLDECIERGRNAIGWNNLEQPAESSQYRAAGIALCGQISGVPGNELGAAQIKMNEDGTFVLQTGAVDTGSGNDTMVRQIASEVLGCAPDDIILMAADTDAAPFDYGSYSSSTTYISGRAVKKAAEEVRSRLLYWAGKLLDEPTSALGVGDGVVYSEASGESVTLSEIGYGSIYGDKKREQIMGQGNHSTDQSPPPFGAQFADVTVDAETGEYEINNLIFAADCGTVVNPPLAEGQVEGGEHISLEFVTSGTLEFDDGQPQVKGFRQYGMPRTTDHPPMDTIFVETHEPTGPFGAKSIAELPTNGVAPAVRNAVQRAVGANIRTLPITPAKIRRALDR